MDSSADSRMTTKEKNTDVTRQDVTCCVNVANPARKIVKQPEACTNVADESVKITQNDNNSKYDAIQLPTSTILMENENDVIDLSEDNPLTQEVSSSAQLRAVNQKDVCELEDDSNERIILIEVTDTGTQASSLNKNQANTKASTDNLVSSEFNLEKTAVVASGNLDNRGSGAQIKKNLIQISNIRSKASDHQNAVCSRCLRLAACRYIPSMRTYVCVETCYETNSTPGRTEENNESQSVETVLPQKFRPCSFCSLPKVTEKITLTWETMEFCCVECLSRYQIQRGSFCFFCRCLVRLPSMGKCAVRIGFEIRQFCSIHCLEEFKSNQKLCRHCQVDLTNEDSIVRTPLDAKESIVHEFCSHSCAENQKLMRSGSKIPPSNLHDFCTVCSSKKQVEIQVIQDSDLISLCSYICFRTFRFANSMDKMSHCNVCKKFFPPGLPNSLFLYHNGILFSFCCKICHNIFLLMKRKIVSCYWCKVKKFDHDMIQQISAFGDSGGVCVTVCSINCLTLYRVSVRASSKRQFKCDLCSKFALARFNLIMTDTSTRHFCSYECVANFRARHRETPSVLLKKDKPDPVPITFELSNASQNTNCTAVKTVLISASPISESRVPLNECSTNTNFPAEKFALKEKQTENNQTKHIQQVILKPPEPKDSTNKFTQCKPSTNDRECQTDEFLKYPPVLPIPVPIYVPFPIPMYGIPIPVPIPVTQICPLPVLIPTPEKTYQSIMFQKKITPADSSNGTVMTNRMLTVTGENGLENNISSEYDDDVNTHPAEGASVEFSSLSQDDDKKFPQTEELVFYKARDEILQINPKTDNKRATQNAVVDFEAERVSNVIKRGTQTKDDEKMSRTVELVRNVNNQRLNKIMQTHQKTVNERATQDSVVEFKPKPVSVSFGPRTQIEDDGKKVPQNLESRRNECNKSLQTSANKSATLIIDELIPKSASKVTRTGTQKKNDGEKISRTVELTGNVINKRVDKIMPIHQKNKNERTTKYPVVELKTKPASIIFRPRTQTKGEGITSNPSQAPAEKSLLRKRISESTAGPSNSKRSRPEHVTSNRSKNNQIPKSQKLNGVSSSSLLEAKQANADSLLSLKVSDGLSVWKQWLTATNTKIKKSPNLGNKRPKHFSSNILKLTVDELNYLLCKFVKEIRQPNGAEYAADSIYYLCLCIQYYLFENGCINNIFVDNLYQPFINALDEVARKFSGNKDTSRGVEEELLWECEQLGGHSPYILVATLLFFNTKFFKLLTVDEHMRLSFSNIVRMKKRSSSTSVNSNKTDILRFYPSTTAFGVPKSHKKTYYEVHKDEENVLRCPVRLFEFYLSKCHGKVKRRNDVFYLQPEGSCLPDSPIWFSATPLPKDILVKMFHRIKMVKEINI